MDRTIDGLTIPNLLRRNATESAEAPALSSGPGPDAQTLTWAQLRSEVSAATRGLSALGLDRGERMLIMMSKRPEHWIVDLAATHLGALPCTLYDTLSTDEIRFIAQHSRASVVVLEDAEQMRRWQPLLAELPDVRAFVLLDEQQIPPGDARFVSYADLRGDGRRADYDSTFEKLTDAVAPQDPLTLVYTSGTTGNPKGVVLSHRNVLYETAMQEHLLAVPEHPRSLAYLPLAHIAERVLGIYMPVRSAGHVTICPDPNQLLQALVAVRPNALFGVPRIWEKIAAGLQARLEALPEDQASAVERAREVSLRVFRLQAEGAEIPEDLAAEHRRWDEQVLAPIREVVGLDASHRNVSGAAPITSSVLEFLASVGIPVYEVWGLSETTGAATVSSPSAFAFGAVGSPAPGMEVASAEDGELLVRGPVVCLGYLQADGAIAPATDADGWFPSGDVGGFDDNGLVAVTDRKKELIITAGGKNIPPTKIEGLLRGHPLVGQAVAIGDRRRYVTALLVLDEQAAPAWAAEHGVEASDLADLARDPRVRQELDALVEQVNESLAHVEQIKDHRVLERAWTAESGELTPKLSLRRRVIDERYAEVIDQMYV